MVLYRVYKYPIPIEDEFIIVLPKNGNILHFDVQYGVPQLWVLVNPDSPTENVRFRLLGTGHDIDINSPDELQFIGTIQLHNGSLVYHLFRFIEG